MHEFAIWAPAAKTMQVKVNHALLPMQGPDEQGWWRLPVDAAGPGTDYGFKVNQEDGIFPDPRSLWQPHGVHGLSRVYDHGAFAWSDSGFRPEPLSSAVIYELHIGTFTSGGTLD